MILLVMVCQTIVYREVTALFALGAPKSDVAEAKGKDPWSKTLNWYFFAVTNYQGTFEIKNLPPGNYVIEAWHEKYGTQTQNVTITGTEGKTVDFNFKG